MDNTKFENYLNAFQGKQQSPDRTIYIKVKYYLYKHKIQITKENILQVLNNMNYSHYSYYIDDIYKFVSQ